MGFENFFGDDVKYCICAMCTSCFIVIKSIETKNGQKQGVKVAKNAGHYLNQNSIEITDSYDHFSTSRLDKIPLNKD